jgi:hypothetical protein
MDEPRISERVAATKFARRRILQLGAGAVAFSLVSPMARAQAYPAKPIKVIIPNLAGSGVDVSARAVTQHLSVHLGQPLVIDNRPGAGTTLGAKAVAGAEADGYTLFIGSIPTLAIGAALYPSAGYDPITSFAPVASLSGSPFFLVVHPSVPAKNLQEFIGYAKANPGKLTFGFGIGTHPHVLGEHFKVTTKTDIHQRALSSKRAIADRSARWPHSDERRHRGDASSFDSARKSHSARLHRKDAQSGSSRRPNHVRMRTPTIDLIFLARGARACRHRSSRGREAASCDQQDIALGRGTGGLGKTWSRTADHRVRRACRTDRVRGTGVAANRQGDRAEAGMISFDLRFTEKQAGLSPP